MKKNHRKHKITVVKREKIAQKRHKITHKHNLNFNLIKQISFKLNKNKGRNQHRFLQA
jgi:hypothetical protein